MDIPVKYELYTSLIPIIQISSFHADDIITSFADGNFIRCRSSRCHKIGEETRKCRKTHRCEFLIFDKLFYLTGTMILLYSKNFP